MEQPYNLLTEDITGKMVSVTEPERLTKSTANEVQRAVIDGCGWLAGLAATEALETALGHGKNHTCQLIETEDYLVLVLESDCPDGNHPSEAAGAPRESVIGSLCQQGIVLYYYHTIYHRHHRVCLALKHRASPEAEAFAII